MATLPSSLSVTLRRASALRNTLAYRVASLMRPPRAAKLAIEGLPEQFAGLQPQDAHALYIADTAVRDALLFDTARASKAAHTTLVLARNPKDIAAALRARGFGASNPAAAWPSKLNVLALPSRSDADAEPEPDMPIAPLTRLVSGLRALKRFGLKPGTLYIIEGADHWFHWRNAAVLAQEARFLADWCELRRSCVLLVFTDSHLAPGPQDDPLGYQERQGVAATAGALNGFHGAFGGVASLLKSHGEMIWKIEFWRAFDTMVSGESVPVRFTETGALAIAKTTIDDEKNRMLLTRDENRVVVSQVSVAGEKYVPADWEIVANNQAALPACRHARGATVLLDYSGQNALADLCETIHTLRRHCGQALKIVVRERHQFMRHQYELLILNLGANQVIGRDVPFSRLQFLLKSLQGQLCTRPIAHDFQTALSAAICASICGYLTVPLFCEQIEMLIERGQVLNLPHLLLHLQLRPEIAHLDALNACILKRDGDICSADANGLYLFLFGCRISDADTVMLRIFGENAGRFFENEVRYIDNMDFLEQVQILKNNYARYAAPDYSDALSIRQVQAPVQLQQAQAAAPPATVEKAVKPVSRDKDIQDIQDIRDIRPHAQLSAMPLKNSTRL